MMGSIVRVSFETSPGPRQASSPVLRTQLASSNKWYNTLPERLEKGLIVYVEALVVVPVHRLCNLEAYCTFNKVRNRVWRKGA